MRNIEYILNTNDIFVFGLKESFYFLVIPLKKKKNVYTLMIYIFDISNLQ